MKRRSGYSLTELVVALALASGLLVIAYGAFHLVFASTSSNNVSGLTRRSYLQKDAKAGVRRLLYRLREGIQVLSPAPGTTASELVFRDITNVDVRVRHIAAEKRVVSERLENGAWISETGPQLITTGRGAVPASWPVQISNCPSIRFTAVAADCVTVQASLEWEGQLGSLLTLIKMRNASQGF